MSWITYDYECDFCDWTGDILQKRSEDSDKQHCPICTHTTTRLLSAPSLLAGEIREKVHGGTIKDGKIIREYTGFEGLAEQNRLEKKIRRAKDVMKDKKGALEIATELAAKRKEGKKKL